MSDTSTISPVNQSIIIPQTPLKSQTIENSVIFEAGYTGHRIEYISHLMEYINSTSSLFGKYIFLLHEKSKPKLGGLTDSSAYQINFFSFEQKTPNAVRKGFDEWKSIAPYFEAHPIIKSIIFLDIDPYLPLIGMRRFRKLQLNVSGIVFQPYVHFRNSRTGSIKKIKPFFKNFLFQKLAVLRNAKIHSLFVLNDKDGVASLNKQLKPIFQFLPDPIDNRKLPATITSDTAAEKFGLRDNKKKLLLFGRIDRRKNLLNIIEALRLMPAGQKSDVRLIIAGDFDQNVKDAYLNIIRENSAELDIFCSNGFVSDEERIALFDKTDLVLMPYINFYSSSGVLGHAIKSGKNVVVSRDTLVSRIVSENNIGLAVDPTDPAAIKTAITALLYGPSRLRYENKILIEQYSPMNFAKTLLGNR